MHRALALAAPLLLAAAGCSDLLGGGAELAHAERAVERWVARHPTGAAFALASATPLQRAAWSPACRDDPPSGMVSLRHVQPGADLLLIFRCPVAEPLGPAELQAAFSHAVLDRLPHGISVRGWRFVLSTPSSAVSEGVTVAGSPGGRLRITIPAELYAVRGWSTARACEPLVDGPAIDGCWVHREHRVPLSVTLDVPADFGALR